MSISSKSAGEAAKRAAASSPSPAKASSKTTVASTSSKVVGKSESPKTEDPLEPPSQPQTVGTLSRDVLGTKSDKEASSVLVAEQSDVARTLTIGGETSNSLSALEQQDGAIEGAQAKEVPTTAPLELRQGELLSNGSRGAKIEQIQDLLNQQGAQLDTDGIFGPLTEAAVRNFQQENNLRVDGIVGPETQAALNRSAGIETPPQQAAPAQQVMLPVAGLATPGEVREIGPPTGELVDVGGGKLLDSSVAGNYLAMVEAARRDGIELGISSAYRSRAEQERLYAAYLAGTGNLAARPGTSNHEFGQAIDFRGTPGAFDWLVENAERFGLRNLPGEPWHYSPNGR